MGLRRISEDEGGYQIWPRKAGTIRHAASAWLSRGRPSPGLLTVQLRREVREALGLQSFPWCAFPSGPSNQERNLLTGLLRHESQVQRENQEPERQRPV